MGRVRKVMEDHETFQKAVQELHRNGDWQGLPVKGYEVDAGWWESKYCPPKFWPHIECVDVDSLPDIDDDDALLFCYFNNLAAFDRYLNKFNGSCIVLIGPGEGSGRHCDPSPFYLRNDANWDVHSVHDNAFNDAIVVYKRVRLWIRLCFFYNILGKLFQLTSNMIHGK